MLNTGTYKEKLEALAADLAVRLEGADDKTYAGLARQYRETICELDRIEGMEQTNDEIQDILTEREADGKPGAIRQNLSTV